MGKAGGEQNLSTKNNRTKINLKKNEEEETRNFCSEGFWREDGAVKTKKIYQQEVTWGISASF